MSGLSILEPLLEQLAALPAVVAMLLKTSLLLLAAWAVHGLLRGANPRWRVLVWRATAVGVLLLPALHLATPAVHVRSTVAPLAFPANRPVIGTTTSATARATANGPVTLAGPPPAESVEPSLQRFTDDSSASLAWWIVSAVWLSGCLFFLVRLVVGERRVQQLIRASSPAPATVATALQRVGEALSVRPSVSVRVSDQLTAPVICQCLRPVILLPTRMHQPDRSGQLPGVFAHELAHVQGADLLWNLLLHAVSAVLWFHPLAWRMRAAHAAACESVSDNVAAAYLGDVGLYGRTLARVALDAAIPPTTSLAMARTADVRQRIAALERHVFAKRPGRLATRSALLLWLLVSIGVSGLNAVRGEALIQPPAAAAGAGQAVVDSAPQDRDPAAAGQPAEKNPIPPAAAAGLARGIAFLAARQREDGSIGGEKIAANRPAVTALSGMAMLAAGSKPGKGQYGKQLDLALTYVLGCVRPDGQIAAPAGGSLYVHGYALRFLGEAHRASPSPRTAKAIQRAVGLLVDCQNESDGWRYSPVSKDADSSITACQLIALQTARRAGIEVPAKTIDRAVAYLKRCQTKDGGFAYVTQGAGATSGLPRSAAAMTALYLARPKDPALAKGLIYLAKTSKKPVAEKFHHYYAQYYLSSALGQAGSKHFDPWYDGTQARLLKQQKVDGSWTNSPMGTEYGTAKACLILLSPLTSAKP